MRTCKFVLGAMGVLAFSAGVFAGPRPEADVTPDGLQKTTFVGVSRIESLPPLPPGARANTIAQPTNLNVPVYLHLSDQEMASGGTADWGYTKAVVYRSGADTGYGNFNKSSAAGNFVANLLHLGNGFPVDGGEIDSFETLIYNSVSSPGGNAACTVALWDGDPLGWIDTRYNAVPQPIPGTSCDFSGMVQAGSDGSTCVAGYCVGGFADGFECLDDSDCGLCPAIGHDDIDDCPGLYRLQCNFENKVMIPSRNVWLVIEWTGGCRMGWRWAYMSQPVVAAIGEENFCAGTCPASPGPCVDLAIELVDGISQWSGYGTGTCCEDGSACDHYDYDTSNDCGHATSCSDGVATDFSGWCFGAEIYWAAFVTSVYANTDTYIQFSPAVIDLDKPETSILLVIELGGWDGGIGTQLKTWQAMVDAGGYTSGLAGALTVQRAPCTPATQDVDCKFYDLGSVCHTDGLCTAGWQNEGDPPDPNALLGINAVDISQPYYRYGSTSLSGAMADPGVPVYGGHLALDMLAGSMGTFTVGFKPDPDSFLKDGANMPIPLVGLIPAKITVAVGKCCVPLGGGDFDCVSHAEGPYMTANDCAAAGGIFTAGESCDPTVDDNDECGCTEDDHCDDGDVCTDDWCEYPPGLCHNDPVFNPLVECCDIVTGVLDPIDDGNQCTADSCSDDDSRGYAIHDAAAMLDVPCADDTPCDTILDKCDGAGNCVGTPITDYACSGEVDPTGYCKALDPPGTNPAECGVSGFCICELPAIGFEILPSDKPNGMCFAHGEKILVNVIFDKVPLIVNGGQFTVYYDPDCVEFNSIEGVDPYEFELYEDVDEAAGSITYAIGVNPFGGVGVSGRAALAVMSFTKLPGCINCIFTIGGENPVNTYLVDDTGQALEVVPDPSAELHENDKLTLKVPVDMKVNVDCDATTAMVAWDWPWADSSCAYEDCNPQFDKCYDPALDCWGYHESGHQYSQDVVYKGGEMPLGVSTFGCAATSNICGDSISDGWTVTVNDQTTLDLTIQLSPIITGDVIRCIEFELFENCVEDPLVFSRDIFFGGIWDHIGHFTDTLKIPDAGQWLCITARDQLHSLRSVSDLPCVDGAYVAEFKGDPFFGGGNWLINGNLDGWKKDVPGASHDVIDILDFGQFVANYLVVTPVDTPCVDGHAMPGPHADINADGIVDALDFAFVMMNYMAQSKDSCCPDSAAAANEGRTSISVRELRALGMGDLTVADLNNDGMVDGDDMAAFTAGHVPSAKPTRPGSRIR